MCVCGTDQLYAYCVHVGTSVCFDKRVNLTTTSPPPLPPPPLSPIPHRNVPEPLEEVGRTRMRVKVLVNNQEVSQTREG